MRRRLLIGLGLLAATGRGRPRRRLGAGGRAAGAIAGLVAGARPPIVVGLLHSQTGPMAISEKSLIDAERMAVEEINARGGVAGRRIEGKRPTAGRTPRRSRARPAG